MKVQPIVSKRAFLLIVSVSTACFNPDPELELELDTDEVSTTAGATESQPTSAATEASDITSAGADASTAADSTTNAPTTSAPTSSTGGGATSTGSASAGDDTSGSSTGDGPVVYGDSPAGFGFVAGTVEPDLGCSIQAQDCGAAEKCTAWVSEGAESWNGTRCVPVGGERMSGQSCSVVETAASGLDDCVAGAMCWGVDPETLGGVCVATCGGTPASPSCGDPGTDCLIANQGALAVCLPSCDPLSQDCEGGCYDGGNSFLCAPDASGVGGADDAACSFTNDCDPGLLCRPTAQAGCAPGVAACCQRLCDVSAAPAGNGCAAGTSCEAYYGAGMAPPGLEDTGLCI